MSSQFLPNFLPLPPEFMQKELFKFLPWNDLLRLRRVSTTAKYVVDDYIQQNPRLTPEMEINQLEPHKNFDSFLNMGIPTRKIFLNNDRSGCSFFETNPEDISEFLELHGRTIHHLRLSQLSLRMSLKEWEFLEALPNLQSLEAAYYGAGSWTTTKQDFNKAFIDTDRRLREDPNFLTYQHSKALERIKSIKVGEKWGPFTNINSRTYDYFLGSPVLEFLELPYSHQIKTTSIYQAPEGYQEDLALCFVFNTIGNIMEYKHFENKLSLKTFSFAHYHYDESFEADARATHGSQQFAKLLASCIKYNVKLQNVGALWLEAFNAAPQQIRPNHPDLGIPILSLVNLSKGTLLLNMPNLEKIEIRKTSKSYVGNTWRQDRPHWPALKELDITVDSKHVETRRTVLNTGRFTLEMWDGKELFQFFFLDIHRAAMTDLRLNFVKEVGSVTIPKTGDIVASCPNLKKLTIINWPGTNNALTKLWKGLPGLEELSLENCKNLGNSAFVGEDEQHPVFLKLTKLRKLSLKGLDQMPKITDTLFRLVIRHMALSHLMLSSSRPLTAVTPNGIRSLNDSTFAMSIERFPFQGWSMCNISIEEFQNLEKTFQSYNMM